MQMQLRQFRKKKSIGDEDLGYEEKPPKSHKKTKPKVSIEKERSMDEFSNFSRENENKHLLRTQPTNVKDKYKNMNSGKYLYSGTTNKKIPSTKKINKPQLKYITVETINHFKKFLSRLYKKEEETLLNKKKKREETKQKNKYEKNKINNINNPNHYNYYPGMYMPPMQINNQNPAYFNEYQNYYYVNPQSYQMGQQMIGPQYYPPYIIPQNTLEDSLNIIYNRGIVNNIIGAFFIKECLDRQRQGQRQSEKRTVPVSTVDLNDEQGDIRNNNDNTNNEFADESNNKLSYMVNDFKLRTENQENKNDNENMNYINKNQNENEEKEENQEEENKKIEGDIKEENSAHNENELKKPSMV
jgi:hypothetical protein